MPIEELFADLSEVRSLLSTSPLVASCEASLAPLGRAVERLRADQTHSLPDDVQVRLRREVAGVGELLGGLGHWLTACGALTPTYNRQAELKPARSSLLVVEG